MSYVQDKLIYEVINEVKKARKKADKIDILKSNDSGALRDVLRGTYDDSIVWLLPSGEPPYVPNKEGSIPSNLRKECVNFKYLVKGGPGNNMLGVKREKIFIGILESIHPNDAKLIIDMVNKKPIQGVTKKLVQETFPGLILK